MTPVSTSLVCLTVVFASLEQPSHRIAVSAEPAGTIRRMLQIDPCCIGLCTSVVNRAGMSTLAKLTRIINSLVFLDSTYLHHQSIYFTFVFSVDQIIKPF